MPNIQGPKVFSYLETPERLIYHCPNFTYFVFIYLFIFFFQEAMSEKAQPSETTMISLASKIKV